MSKVYSFGWIGLTTILVAWATALVALSSASELESIDGCVIVPTQWSDGDSFLVRLPDKREIVVRLYFVDCIEVDVADITGKRRLREQARYFGVEDLIAVRNFGTEATRFVAETLSQPFRLHTAFANALGRSGKPRIYAFVTTPEGRDLGELLVEKGLARAHGQKRKTPDGTHRDDWNAQLSDVELVAAVRGAGVWAQSDPAKIVAMRRVEREEQRALVLIVDGPPSDPPEEPIDVNSASLKDLARTGLRESLADQIIKGRPFDSIEQLLNVRGIGPVTLEKVRPYLKVESEVKPEVEPEKSAP